MHRLSISLVTFIYLLPYSFLSSRDNRRKESYWHFGIVFGNRVKKVSAQVDRVKVDHERGRGRHRLVNIVNFPLPHDRVGDAQNCRLTSGKVRNEVGRRASRGTGVQRITLGQSVLEQKRVRTEIRRPESGISLVTKLTPFRSERGPDRPQVTAINT